VVSNKKIKKTIKKKRKINKDKILDENRIVKSVSKKSAKGPSLSKTKEAGFIKEFFDQHLKDSFDEFLLAKVTDIEVEKRKIKNDEKKYKKEGKELISFKETSSHNYPDFSAGGPFSPEEYNPDNVDVSTYTLMRRDPLLSAGLALIKLPIIGLPWRINCDDEKIAKTVTWAISKIWKSLVKSSLLAVDYGFSSHEKVWTRDDVKISKIDKSGKEIVYHNGDLVFFKKIKSNHPETISMKFDELQNLIEIIQQSTIGKDKIHLPIRKVFLFTNEKEFGNPFGTSRLKNAYKVWYWKELLYQFMMQYYERRGTPSTLATVPPGKSIDSSGSEINNMELGLRMASSLIGSSTAVIPYTGNKDTGENMWKLEFLKDDARGPMFVEAMQHVDAMCLRSIYVPENLLIQEGGSAYGGVSVHADLFLMTEKGLIADFEESVDEQLINPFIQANYPPNKRRVAHIKLDPLDWNRKIMLKEIFTEMLRNVDTMIQKGVAPTIIPSLEKMAENLEIPMETWKDYTGREDIPVVETGAGAGDSRVKTRRENVPQESSRVKRQPGDKRSDRDRKVDTSKTK
jgi:hypothetical protein